MLILCLTALKLYFIATVSAQTPCSPPDPIDNIEYEPIQSSYDVGTQITLSCSLGFNGGGPNTRTCQNDGTWTDVEFRCDRQQCSELFNSTNTIITLTMGNLFGSTATYSCTEGHNLNGPSRRTCSVPSGSDIASWSGSEPTCDPVQCPLPDLPDGVTYNQNAVSQPIEFGDTIDFTCENSSLILSDDSLSPGECGADGTWGEFPTCVTNFLCDFNPSDSTLTFCSYTNVGWVRATISGVPESPSSASVPVAQSGFGVSTLTSPSLTVPATGACIVFYLFIENDISEDFTVQLKRAGQSDMAIFNGGRVARPWEFIEVNLDPSLGEVSWEYSVSNSQRNVYMENVSLRRSSCSAESTTATAPGAGSTTATAPVAGSTTSTTVNQTNTVAEETGTTNIDDFTTTRVGSTNPPDPVDLGLILGLSLGLGLPVVIAVVVAAFLICRKPDAGTDNNKQDAPANEANQPMVSEKPDIRTDAV